MAEAIGTSRVKTFTVSACLVLLRVRLHSATAAPRIDFVEDVPFNPLLDKLDGLMIKGFLPSKENKARYKIRTPKQFIPVKTSITTMDLMMAEIVCNILGSYYKSQNRQKQIPPFKVDQHMFDFLIRISSINSHRTMPKIYRDSLFPQLKSQKLFPWKRNDSNLPHFLPQ
ncbi:hypothetical protein MJO28_016094 [Puccinia striiformis f. sp. tritici]|uniref:Uncharacterized protein n=2 Tax=Puccinia striiformis TaxID=27350 RepID=A0ACC0DQH7_9BASI